MLIFLGSEELILYDRPLPHPFRVILLGSVTHPPVLLLQPSFFLFLPCPSTLVYVRSPSQEDRVSPCLRCQTKSRERGTRADREERAFFLSPTRVGLLLLLCSLPRFTTRSSCFQFILLQAVVVGGGIERGAIIEEKETTMVIGESICSWVQ